jgi:mRNA interferase MazF
VYHRGDVVLIPFPYTDLSAQKTRPAIVVSSDRYHTLRPDVLLLYVSSQIDSAVPELDVTLEDWREARLLKPSFARPKIAAIDPSLVVFRVDALSGRDLAAVSRSLIIAFGLEETLG